MAMFMPGRIHLAIQAIDRAVAILVGMTLKLNGTMSNPVLLGEHGFQRTQDRRALACLLIRDGRMAREGIHATGDPQTCRSCTSSTPATLLMSRTNASM